MNLDINTCITLVCNYLKLKKTVIAIKALLGVTLIQCINFNYTIHDHNVNLSLLLNFLTQKSICPRISRGLITRVLRALRGEQD